MAARQKRTVKFQMMLSPQEAETLDDWAFKNRLKSRAEAIRRLCAAAISAENGAYCFDDGRRRGGGNREVPAQRADSDASNCDTQAHQSGASTSAWER